MTVLYLYFEVWGGTDQGFQVQGCNWENSGHLCPFWHLFDRLRTPPTRLRLLNSGATLWYLGKNTVTLHVLLNIFFSLKFPAEKGCKGYPLNFLFWARCWANLVCFSVGVCLRFQTIEHFDIWAQTKILATDHHSLLLTTMFTLYDEALCLLIHNCLYQIEFTRKERCRKIQKLSC